MLSDTDIHANPILRNSLPVFPGLIRFLSPGSTDKRRFTFLNHIFLAFTCFTTILVLLPASGSLRAQTEVEGEVSGVWDVEGSPYLVIDTLIVPEDLTLTIEPGVTVEFQDQDENQFPFIVLGTLEALGDEGDSIYFLSEDSTFPGFRVPDNLENTILRFEYCVVDSVDYFAQVFSGEEFTLRHSRIHNAGRLLLRSYDTADTLEYCHVISTDSIGASIQIFIGAPSVFRYNEGRIWFRTWGTVLESFNNNTIINALIEDIEIEVYDNQFDRSLKFDGCTLNVHDNTIPQCDISGSNGVVEFNNLGHIYINENSDLVFSQNTINHDGVFGGHYSDLAYVRDSEVVFDHNMMYSFRRIFRVANSDLEVYNNTMIFHETGIYFSDGTVLDAINNIFTGDGVNCPVIDRRTGEIDLDRIRHNVINNVSEIIRGVDDVELDPSNLIVNPRFNGGEPFDYHLQANSPCIDAGDPDSPEDPDETIADIGCYFYDQSIDNPPAMISPVRLIEQAGTEFRYTALVIDDEGPLTFHFENLPDWLEEEENNLAWVADSAVVSGTIPEDIEEFEFNVYVEDGLEQFDSANVFCEVIQYSILRGITTGVVSAENSPYLIVEDVIVPEGDSLIIEPGCELYFRLIEHEDSRLEIEVHGMLIADGTEEDSIRFGMLEEEAVNGGWRGVRFFESVDTSLVRHCRFEYGYYSIVLDPNSVVVIEDSFFPIAWYYTIFVKDEATLFLNDDVFYTDSDQPFRFIKSGGRVMFIDSCIFIDAEMETNRSVGINVDSSIVNITNTTFIRSSSISLNYSSRGYISKSMFYGSAISELNFSRITVSNNKFYGGYNIGNRNRRSAINTHSAGDSIINNIFNDVIAGIRIVEDYEDGDHFPLILNNVFENCDVAIRNNTDPERDFNIQYNDFWNNDTIAFNCPIDSAINIFDNPLFADTLFHLYLDSPLIDTGHPDEEYNDIDSSRNDIGIWGGPLGESYEYFAWVNDEQLEIPGDFLLFTPYPNPFNQVQTIRFTLPHQMEVKLSIYNILGQKVFSKQFPQLHAGYHTITYNAETLSSGLYFIELTAGKKVRRKKVVLLK